MSYRTLPLVIILLNLSSHPLLAADNDDDGDSGADKQVTGWVERVTLHPGGLTLRAKIDSGAKTSSLHCDDCKVEKIKGENWIAFNVTNIDGHSLPIKTKVLGTTTIKRHFGKSQQRYVIRLGICLADVYKEEEVNLVDRSGLSYPLLIGRNFLAGDFLIDPETTYTQTPRCKKTP